jgi:tetratricopeptide (TPR) repeat protein
MKKTMLLILSGLMFLNLFSQEEEFIGRGLALEEMGEYRMAIEQYDSALKYNAESAVALYNRGVCYAALGETGQALADYNKALNIDRMLADAYFNRSLIHKQMGNLVLAGLDLEYYLELVPDDTLGFLALASVYEADHNYIKAFEQYESALEFGLQDKHLAYLAMGLCKFYTEEDEKAEEFMTLAIELNSANHQARYFRGKVRMALSKWELAASDFTYYLENEPMDVNALHSRAECYQRLVQFSKAMEEFEKLILLQPAEWKWFFEKGNCLLQLKRDEEAENFYSKSLILSDEPSLVLLMRGIARFNQKKSEEACFDWEQSSLLGESEAKKLFQKQCVKP